MRDKVKCAVIGPGNIGTDLLAKLQRSDVLAPVWMVGVDPASEGLRRAEALGLKTTDQGVDGMLPTLRADGVQIVFDATSASAHADNSRKVNAEKPNSRAIAEASALNFSIAWLRAWDATRLRSSRLSPA